MTARIPLFIIALVQKVISAADMREIDRLTTEQFALPSLLLMETAARAAAQAIEERLPGGIAGTSILILCGRGNNGGDGAALARLLSLRGAFVDVVLFGRVEDTKGDARTNFEIAYRLADGGAVFQPTDQPVVLGLTLNGRSGGHLSFTECLNEEDWNQFLYFDFPEAPDVLVDALFGTGLTRPLEGLHAEAVRYVNRARAMREASGASQPLVVSLDLPSGLNADVSTLIGDAVRAHLTVTFTAPKPANVLPPASYCNGELVIADIGSPAKLIDAAPSQLFLTKDQAARQWLRQTRYTPDSYKNTHGHALLIAGSRRYSGAAVLCGDAAMRAGAGLVTVATPASAVAPVAARLMPEVMTAALPETSDGAVSEEAIEIVSQLSERAQAVALGPVLSAENEGTRRLVRAIVEHRMKPMVLDADALNALAPWPAELRGTAELPLILTPHEGEMRRLLGGANDEGGLADRVGTARAFAVKHELILVLKGSRTLVAATDGRVFINPTGNAGLGTAGAGDTLTGIITGFLAQAYGTLADQADALLATLSAVYLGGMAGDLAARELGMRTMTASDIRRHLGAAICALDVEGERP
ncbi:MAG: NAD(P)H-hydrate dehydratase [Acidobacteriota bacterium]|nr:NAD(P)H-hydrate dehydratase [Acidobacteriota bacterium]